MLGCRELAPVYAVSPDDLPQMEAMAERGWCSILPRGVSVINQTASPSAAVDATEKMRELILEIVHALVDQPEDVSVEMLPDVDSTVIRLRVAHQDIGKVIGKQGRTARSLRTILGAASMKMHHRFALDIVEDK